MTAILADGILRLVGFPTMLTGVEIELPHIFLVVAPECNGIKHMLVLIIVALVIASNNGFIFLWHGISAVFAFITGIFVNSIFIQPWQLTDPQTFFIRHSFS